VISKKKRHVELVAYTLLSVGIFMASMSALAEESDKEKNENKEDQKTTEEQVISKTDSYAEQTWGIAMGVRYAEIPYITADGDRTVADVIPLMFFENKYFYLRGLEGGVKFINKDLWKLNAILRYRFIDIPAEYQNEISGAWDAGLQTLYRTGDWDFRTDFMTDGDARIYADLGFETSIGNKYAAVYPYIGIRVKSSDFNTYYYGLDREYIQGGIDLRGYIEGRYHVVSNLYVIGRLGGTILDQNACNSVYVKQCDTWDAYAGIAFFNNPDKPREQHLKNNAYIRFAHGTATPSNLGEILQGDKEDDPYNNQLSSVFYGYPLTDNLFGLPIDIYLTPGLVFHHSSEVQENFLEYVLAIKADYTVKWPVRWRFGVAEGLSYSSQINYVERTELEAKGYQPSQLLNYLDFTLDINIGDIFSSNSWRNTWFGYSIHHRSGIFETGSQFGRIKGGSNYTTFYLQQHF
jgi:MipA family protein